MDLTFRFNTETDDVEIVAGDKVIDTIGTDVVRSWVTAYNKKHGFVERVEQEKEEAKTEETESAETETTEEVDATEGE